MTQRIDKVVPGVVDADEDLTRARSRDFNLSNLDHANVALFEDLSGAHLGGDLLMGGRHGAADLGEAGLSDSWRRRQGGGRDVGEQASRALSRRRRRAGSWR